MSGKGFTVKKAWEEPVERTGSAPVPAEMKIGPVEVRPATVLAPMAGVTDTVFRRLIRSQGGCGLIMTEFTSSHGIVAAARATKPTRTFRYLYFEPDEHPISAQLFGSDPAVIADAATVATRARSGVTSPLPSGWTRFDRNTTNAFVTGSIQREVPVKPV